MNEQVMKLLTSIAITLRLDGYKRGWRLIVASHVSSSTSLCDAEAIELTTSAGRQRIQLRHQPEKLSKTQIQGLPMLLDDHPRQAY